jgi:hypothetical protein
MLYKAVIVGTLLTTVLTILFFRKAEKEIRLKIDETKKRIQDLEFEKFSSDRNWDKRIEIIKNQLEKTSGTFASMVNKTEIQNIKMGFIQTIMDVYRIIWTKEK